MLETLLNAMDATDAQTGAHVRRVARYASILARAADLGSRQVHAVERVALFHDIGKIDAALYDIIHDRMQLTPEERQAIATHPRRGAEVLAPLAAFDPDLAEGVLSHHERWDGRGYPRGLGGRAIAFSARIVTIADTFDATTFARRYSPALSLAEASAVIATGRGRQFDPALVDLFLFPPVFDEIVDAFHGAPPWSGPDRRGSSRAATPEPDGHHESRPPDVMFRWRDSMQL